MRVLRHRPAMDKHAHDTPTQALLTIAGVAERLAVPERHIRRLVFEKRIPYVKWGHLVRFDPVEIEQWLDDARVGVETDGRGRGLPAVPLPRGLMRPGTRHQRGLSHVDP